MKKFFSVVFMWWLLAMVPQVWAQDVGSVACGQVQLAAQSAVASGGPYRSHGALVSTAAAVVDASEVAGGITEECSSCIVNQFARRIPIPEQTACGRADCGDCLTTGHGTGCEVATCQAAVCAIDEFCCGSNGWDSRCVGEAGASCVDAVPQLCAGPRCGNCVTTGHGTGCEVAACQAAVCAIDHFCCDGVWDPTCVGEAGDLCIDAVPPLCPL